MRRSALLLASLLAVSSTQYISSSIAFAQNATEASEPEMAQYQFSGMVNADNVYVRSDAGENNYPVVKLNLSSMVIVVGTKQDWLKILPPEGTYCLVGKVYVEKRGDGTVGRVREDANNVNVRIPSQLNNMISKVAMQLKPKDDVAIVGEQDEYFKVAPPAGTFMYINRKFVDPVKRVEVINDNGKLVVKPTDEPLPKGMESKKTDEVANNSNNVNVDPPKNEIASNGGTPSTQPTAKTTDQVAAETEFDALEAKLEESSKLALEQQPIDEMLASYQKAASDNKLPSSMIAIAQFRVKGLTAKKEALAHYRETQKIQADLNKKIEPTVVEGNEIKQQLVTTQARQFTAVGTLRQSSLPYGGRTLYRLTDPTTSRTVIYINSDDPNVIKYEGMFIAVNGEVTEDPIRKIKFIAPKDATQLDPAEIIKGTATSNYVPASLMPSASAPQQ